MMNADNLFNAGTTTDIVPEGDKARQAVNSLRCYAYQALAAALAWIDIGENDRLYLEVAEDYTIIADQALRAVQVKDTKKSGSVTLNSESVRDAIAAFVDLAERNPDIQVNLRFFTSSEIGTEQVIADRPAGVAGLEYWRNVAAGADPTPLRTILESDKFPESVRVFSKDRDDEALRLDLIKRIHWDCGKPDFSTLRQELEDRLVVVGRDRFGLPSQEARQLVDQIVYRVLEKSIVNSIQDRVLTRADLYGVIDAATRYSIPRSAVDNLTQFASGLPAPLGGSVGPGKSLSTTETGWLIDGATLPEPRGMIARVGVELAVADALGNFGAVVIVGSSGLGKTIVARAVAVSRVDAFFIVDCGNTDENETRSRLDIVFAHTGGLPSSVLILEDLNHLDDMQVILSLARVIEALRRRDREVLITCYQTPSLKALAAAGLNQGCIVNCPYFSEEEAHTLVLNYGGDPNKWGRLAHVSGAFDHPQLTHAFVTGMSARGWPVEEIGDIFSRGLSSDDTDAARNAARRSLVSALPEGTRNLLYRLSLTVGRFDRPLALTIGEIAAASVSNRRMLGRAGRAMDRSYRQRSIPGLPAREKLWT